MSNDRSAIRKAKWLQKNGFNEQGVMWSVIGENTYSIKDWLKEMGCKYNSIFKWHSDHLFDLPAGFSFVEFHFDDLYVWDDEICVADLKNDAIVKIDKQFKMAEGPSLSEYVGNIGDRIRNLTAIYKSVRGFMGQYGWTNIYTFESENNIIVWFTTKDLDLESGTVVDLTGTIKKFEEFRGVKTTVITRAIVKEIK